MQRNLALGAAALVAAFDLATKALARSALDIGEPVPLLPFVQLTLSYNSGVGFGWFTAFHPIVVVMATAAISLLFLVWLWRTAARSDRMALALIVGGAAGNLVDRMMRGAVTDFIDLHGWGWHWPAFNVADASLTLGVLLFLGSHIVGSETTREPVQ